MLNRRDFLGQLPSLASIGGIVRYARCRSLIAALLDDSPGGRWLAPAPQIRDLARRAIDMALSAGAKYADVRIVGFTGLTLVVEDMTNGSSGYVELLNYRIRALVDGGWGTASGVDLTDSSLRTVVDRAVREATIAKGPGIVLAPAPAVIDGRWADSVTVDPFSVSIEEQIADIHAGHSVILRTPRTQVTTWFRWWRSDTTFASSDGSLFDQTTLTFQPQSSVFMRSPVDSSRLVMAQLPSVRAARGGYEHVRNAKLAEAAARAVDEAKAQLLLKPSTLDIGEYEAVLSPSAVASVLSETIAPALDLDRALGRVANSTGTSFIAPVESVLGSLQVASPLLTLLADRSRSDGLSTVGWDDEGVKPDDFRPVQKGTVVDYFTTRQSAGALASWYKTRGIALRSHGCAGANGARGLPVTERPNLTLETNSGSARVDDLIRDVKRGVFIAEAGGASVDQQCRGGLFSGGHLLEIRNGQLAGYIPDAAFEVRTIPFWNGLEALGGPSSARDIVVQSASQDLLSLSSVRALPGKFKAIRVIRDEAIS